MPNGRSVADDNNLLVDTGKELLSCLDNNTGSGSQKVKDKETKVPLYGIKVWTKE